MTWPSYRSRYLPAFSRLQIRDLPEKERAIVVLATGAIEQHGPQLPVGVDALLAQVYLDRALPRLPADIPVYVAPPIQVAKSNEHDGFPGTLILGRESLRQQILSVGRQLNAWGFRRLRILNTHGGNVSVAKSALRELFLAYGLDVDLLRLSYENGVNAREAAFGIHANEVESSLMYAAFPDLVEPDSAVCRWIGSVEDTKELQPEFAPATYAWKTLDVSRSGVMGDATVGSAEKGERWLELAADALASALVRLAGEEG